MSGQCRRQSAATKSPCPAVTRTLSPPVPSDNYSDRKLSPSPVYSRVMQHSGDMDFEKLGELHQCFVDRWHGEDKGLTRMEFKIAMKRTVGYMMTEEEVDSIYARTDAKECGLLKWSNYITCLSTSTGLRYTMAKQAVKPLFGEKFNIIKTGHRDEIVCIRFIPRLQLHDTKINYNNGRYVTLGREGTLTMWSIDFANIGRHHVGHNKKLAPDYYIDMISLYPSPMIAITNTDRSICIYEFGNRGIKLKYSIVGIKNCLTCMDYWADLRTRTTSFIVWGDTQGDVYALELNVNRLGGMFDKDEQREVITRVIYNDLVKNKITCVKLHKAEAVHNDWVTAVKYIPENKAFLSTSRSFSLKALVYADWHGKMEYRGYTNHTSALCLDYNHVINKIVIGSLDGNIRVWDFFMTARPINTLKGHGAPVTSVCLNPATRHVISCDKNYYVKVFDYLEGTCIQSFSGPSLVCLGKFPISGFFFNPARKQLAVASQRLALMFKKVNPPEMAEISAHDFPISCICYSSFFDELITSCRNGQISVWDIQNGKHKLEFRHYSTRSQFSELPWAKDNVRLEVNAMTLDPNERCAVTGSNDGTINMWNFTQGVLLSHFTLNENVLVTGLAIERNNIFVSSWCNEKLYMLNMDTMGDYQESVKDSFKIFRSMQKEEVNAITHLKNGLVATGCYDGTIMVIRSDTGHFFCRLNPAISHLPLKTILLDAAKKNSEKELDDEDGGTSEPAINSSQNNPAQRSNPLAKADPQEVDLSSNYPDFLSDYDSDIEYSSDSDSPEYDPSIYDNEQDTPFNDGTLENPSLDDSTLKNSTLKDSSLNNPSLEDSTLKDSTLKDSPIKDSPRKDSSLKNPSRNDSTLKDSSLNNPSRNDSTLKDSTLKKSSLKDSSLNNPSHKPPGAASSLNNPSHKPPGAALPVKVTESSGNNDRVAAPVRPRVAMSAEADSDSDSDEGEGSAQCETSLEALLNAQTEEFSILKCFRISPDKIMVADQITGRIKIMQTTDLEQKKAKKPSENRVYDPYRHAYITREESAKNFRAYESSVESMLTLETRKNYHHKTANILTSGSEGWIRAWSLHPKGGLKGQFLATEVLGESAKAMCTDKMNEWLITGDTRGYIKIWDLFAYCNATFKKLSEDEKQARRESQGSRFIFLRSPFLRDEASEGFQRCAKHKKRPPPQTSNPSKTLKTPRLLNVFKAHCQAITALTYIDEYDVFISASIDCSVRLWTARGNFVGCCGAQWENLPDPTKITLRLLPIDLRRTLSARSFHIMKTGRMPKWEQAVKAIKSYLEEKRKDEEKTARLKASQSESQKVPVEELLTQPCLLDFKEGKGVSEELRLCNVVNFDWKDPKKSTILGKTFKPNMHHIRSTNELEPIDAEFGLVAAYRRVNISEMSTCTRIPTPPVILQMAQKKREEEEEAERFRQGEGLGKDFQPPPRNLRSARGPRGKSQAARNSICKVAKPTIRYSKISSFDNSFDSLHDSDADKTNNYSPHPESKKNTNLNYSPNANYNYDSPRRNSSSNAKLSYSPSPVYRYSPSGSVCDSSTAPPSVVDDGDEVDNHNFNRHLKQLLDDTSLADFVQRDGDIDIDGLAALAAITFPLTEVTVTTRKTVNSSGQGKNTFRKPVAPKLPKVNADYVARLQAEIGLPECRSLLPSTPRQRTNRTSSRNTRPNEQKASPRNTRSRLQKDSPRNTRSRLQKDSPRNTPYRLQKASPRHARSRLQKDSPRNALGPQKTNRHGNKSTSPAFQRRVNRRPLTLLELGAKRGRHMGSIWQDNSRQRDDNQKAKAVNAKQTDKRRPALYEWDNNSKTASGKRLTKKGGRPTPYAASDTYNDNSLVAAFTTTVFTEDAPTRAIADSVDNNAKGEGVCEESSCAVSGSVSLDIGSSDVVNSYSYENELSAVVSVSLLEPTIAGESRKRRKEEGRRVRRARAPDECLFPPVTASETCRASTFLPSSSVVGKNTSTSTSKAVELPSVCLPNLHAQNNDKQQPNLSMEERKKLYSGTGLVLRGFSAYQTKSKK